MRILTSGALYLVQAKKLGLNDSYIPLEPAFSLQLFWPACSAIGYSP